MEAVFSSSAAKNIFLSRRDQRRVDFATQIFKDFSAWQYSLDFARSALSQQPYTRYTLLDLIEKSNFRKLENYDNFDKCTAELTVEDLEELSKSKSCEERFLNFMRYVTMLKEDD